MGRDRNSIADELRRDITSGKYRAGDRLPAYRQLAKMLGVAPNTVGEAVHILAAEGLVATRTTSPAVVLSPDSVESSEDRVAAARDDLRDVQADLRSLRGQLGELEQRVSDALDKLNG